MRKTRNRTANTHAFVEQNSGDAPNAADKPPQFNSPVRVVFTHYRKRLCDLDNLSTKAVLDAIVSAGFLAGDSPEQVAEITHRQVKSDDEKTIVTIESMPGASLTATAKP